MQSGPEIAGAPRVFAPPDVFALQRAEDVQVQPDSKGVAYVRARADLMTAEVEAAVPRDAVAGSRYPAAHMAALDSEKR